MSMKTVVVYILALAIVSGMVGMAAADTPVSKVAVHGAYGGVPFHDGATPEHIGYAYNEFIPQSYTAYYGGNETTVLAGDLASAKTKFSAAGLTVLDNATITNDQDKYCHSINQGGMSDEVTVMGQDGKCHVSYGDWIALACLNE